ncbi:MAG: aminotransferase class V-fold PLP-dependent enzyme, partial [Bacillota bacterium]
MMQEIYLDNSATTRPLPVVVDRMKQVLTEQYGNPSSLHRLGLRAEKILKNTRRLLAEQLYVEPAEIYITAGGTESNNL